MILPKSNSEHQCDTDTHLGEGRAFGLAQPVSSGEECLQSRGFKSHQTQES